MENLHRMEETFLRVKTERDELMKRQYRDSIDSGNSRGSSEASTDDIVHLKNELSLQKKAYEAQFIEYVSKIVRIIDFDIKRRFEIFNGVLTCSHGCGLNYD